MRWSAIWSSPIASAGTALRSSDCRRLSNKLISSKTSPEVQLPLAPPSEHMFVVYRKSVRCQAFTRENSRQLLPGVHFATGPCSTAFSQSLGLVRLPTRRARCASRPTSPRGGEASKPNAHLASKRPTKSFFPVLSGLVSPHPACSLRELADLPAWRGGEIDPRGAGRRDGSPRGGETRVLHAPLPNPLPCGERGSLGQARLRPPATVLFEIPGRHVGLMAQHQEPAMLLRLVEQPRLLLQHPQRLEVGRHRPRHAQVRRLADEVAGHRARQLARAQNDDLAARRMPADVTHVDPRQNLRIPIQEL